VARWLDDEPQQFDGRTMQVVVPMLPSQWRLDPKSTIAEWVRPTACELYDVLSAISAVEVAGDLSLGAEVVALDSFGWTAGAHHPR